MTIYIDDLIKKGYCKWENGKIIVLPNCTKAALKELKGIDSTWREAYPESDGIVIFPK